jgi:hypothetical protein
MRLGLIVVHVACEVESIVVVKHEKARTLRRHRVLDRQDLVEIFGLDHRGVGPRRLVEASIDDDRPAGPSGHELLHRRRRGFRLGEHDRRATEHGQGWRQPVSYGRAPPLRSGFTRHGCAAT